MFMHLIESCIQYALDDSMETFPPLFSTHEIISSS